MRPRKRWLISSVVALTLLPLLFWGLVKLVVPGVIRDQAQQFGKQIGYQIEIGEIELTPFALRLQLQDLRIAPLKGEALLTLKQLEVDARFLPLLTGDVSLERVALDTPTLLLSRPAAVGRQAAAWNWQHFVDEVSKATASPPAVDTKPSTMKISVDALVIDGARLALRDGQKQATYDLGPFSLHLTDVRNEDSAGRMGGSSVQSNYTVNLGRVTVPLPKVDGVPDRALSFANVVASGAISSDADASLRAALDLKLDDGELQSTWQVGGASEKGALTGKVVIRDLAVKPWLSLAPSYERLDSPSGVINGSVDLKQDANALTVDGDVKIDQLDIRVVGAKEPLLAWASTALNRLHLVLPRAQAQTNSSTKPGLLTINEIAVQQPRIRFVLNAQRQSNFRMLFSKPEPVAVVKPIAKPEASAEAAAAAGALASKPVVKPAAPAQPEFRYDVRSVRLKQGSMFFADESIKPVFRVDVTDLNGSLQGISNEPNRYASLVLNGRAANTGSLRARGQLAFADPRQNNDASLVFRNIPLNATNPYTMTFAGYAIDDGRIDVDLRYVTKNGELQGKNRFVIKKIKLGEPVPDYQGTRLPLGLAIALLEDADGMIDVNIPVKGNVNEPEFSVGHLVWQAVKTLLANVVTAPFRALGALLGIENMDAIAFVPGESALPAEGDEQLTKIAEYLAKHPNAKFVIHGTYDASVDSAELARAMADKAILEASGIKVVEGEPLPLPNMSDPKVKDGLKTAYGAQVGRIKLGQRLLTLPDNAERDTQLRLELIQSYKVTDDQLKQLATQRADGVKVRLLAVDAKLTGRIDMGDVETVNTKDAGVPIQVSIEAVN